MNGQKNATTPSGELRYEVESGVAIVTFNRPGRMNAMTASMGRAYNAALLRAAEDPGVVAIVVTGAGRAFCGGAELAVVESFSEGSALPDSNEGEFRPALAREVRKPVIAAVNGPAAGVGLALAVHADVRVVASDATLTTRYARLGLVAEYGLAWLLPRLVGEGRARELLLTGRRFTGQEAYDMQLAQWAVPAEEVLPRALEIARDIATSCAPQALAAIKDQLDCAAVSSFDASYQRADELMQISFTSPDLVESFAAAKEKRAPQFRRWKGQHEIYR